MGSFYGTLLCTILTTLGSVLCHILWYFSGRDLLMSFDWFNTKISKLSYTFKRYRKKGGFQMVWFLISLRLFPLTPNWFVNIAGPVLGITVPEQMYSIFIGIIPFNYITVNAGLIISELKSVNDIYQPKTIFFLVALSFISLIPVILNKFSKTTSAHTGELPPTILPSENKDAPSSMAFINEGVSEASNITKGLFVNSVKFVSNMIEKQSRQYLSASTNSTLFPNPHKII